MDPVTARKPDHGFQVAEIGATDFHDAPDLNTVDHDHLVSFLKDRLRAHLAAHPDRYEAARSRRPAIGGWIETGKLWLEPSDTVEDLETARRLGEARNQRTIWDNAQGVPIPTGGTHAVGAQAKSAGARQSAIQLGRLGRHRTRAGPFRDGRGDGAPARIQLETFPFEALRDWVERDDWTTQPEPIIRAVCTRLTQDLPLVKFLDGVTLEKWIPREKWAEGEADWREGWLHEPRNKHGEWVGYGFGHRDEKDFKPGDRVYVWAKGKLHPGVVREPNRNRPGTVTVKPDSSPVMYRRPEVIAHQKQVETVAPGQHRRLAHWERSKPIRDARMAAAALVEAHAGPEASEGEAEEPIPNDNVSYRFFHPLRLANVAQLKVTQLLNLRKREEFERKGAMNRYIYTADLPTGQKVTIKGERFQVEAENAALASKLAEAIDAPLSQTVQTTFRLPGLAPHPETQITYVYVDGLRGADWLSAPGRVQFTTTTTTEVKELFTSIPARRLGLLDYLTGQPDRHGGNFFVDTSSGTPVPWAMDNAFARYGTNATWSLFWTKNKTKILVTTRAWLKTLKGRLEALKTAYKALGRYSTWVKLMESYDGLVKQSDQMAKERGVS